jgi:hypothetical protein
MKRKLRRKHNRQGKKEKNENSRGIPEKKGKRFSVTEKF